MSTAALTDADARARDAVLEQLEWDPRVNATAIGVSAQNGAVTLTGFTDTYASKLAAERAAKRADGVRVVANDIAVRLAPEQTDADIAADVTHALEVSHIPASVQAALHKGHVTLTGTVEALSQKNNAEHAVRRIRGVRSVTDYISLAPRVEAGASGVPGAAGPVEPPDELC